MTQTLGIYTKNADGVWYGVACDDKEVFATTFAHDEKRAVESLMASVLTGTEFQTFSTPSAFAERALNSVKSVYEGKGEQGIIPLATEILTPFFKDVLEVTRLIPVGYVTSYGALSNAAGGSPRAVGGAMAANPFAPIVPCHRVVRSDLTLGGYGGGLDLKTEMLTREKRGNTLPKEIPIGNKKLRIFPVEFSLEKLRRENETKNP
jgi:methylated-DNA-[protein]-cysteine S-methyltransferase